MECTDPMPTLILLVVHRPVESGTIILHDLKPDYVNHIVITAFSRASVTICIKSLLNLPNGFNLVNLVLSLAIWQNLIQYSCASRSVIIYLMCFLYGSKIARVLTALCQLPGI